MLTLNLGGYLYLSAVFITQQELGSHVERAVAVCLHLPRCAGPADGFVFSGFVSTIFWSSPIMHACERLSRSILVVAPVVPLRLL
jgi:hypothetical protein